MESSTEVEREQRALERTYEWPNIWKVPLAREKTEHMRLGASERSARYSLGGQMLSRKVVKVKDSEFHYNNEFAFSNTAKQFAEKIGSPRSLFLDVLQ